MPPVFFPYAAETFTELLSYTWPETRPPGHSGWFVVGGGLTCHRGGGGGRGIHTHMAETVIVSKICLSFYLEVLRPMGTSIWECSD